MDARPGEQRGGTAVALTVGDRAASETPEAMVDRIVHAVTDHRRRVAGLLQRIDELQRHEAVPCVTECEEGTRESVALFAALADRLRTGDDVLRDVVVQLRGGSTERGSDGQNRWY